MSAIQINDLVLVAPFRAPARVVLADATSASLNYPHRESGEWAYLSNLEKVEDADPQVFIKDPLHVRRRRLIVNLRDAQRRCYDTGEQDDYRLIKRVRELVEYGNEESPLWFAMSVAESTDDPRQVSWAEAVKSFDNDPHRKRGRWTVFLNKCRKFGFQITDEEITRFSYVVGTHFPKDYNLSFEVVYGDEIMRAYNDDYGPSSCMKGTNYTRIYCNNPDKVGLIKICRGGRYFGRALLWTLDDGRKFLDRIYPSDTGDHIQAAIEYAESQGWMYKTSQSYGGHNVSDTSKALVVTLNNNVDRWPYFDTLRLTDNDESDEEIVLNNLQGDVEFDCTDGCWPGHSGEVYSEYQSEYIDRDDATWIPGENSWVDPDTLESDFRYINGVYHRESDCVYSRYHDEYLLENSAVYVENRSDYFRDDEVSDCDYTGEACFDEDLVTTYEGSQCYIHRAIQLADGSWAYREDENLVERNGKWFIKEEGEGDEDECENEELECELLVAEELPF